MLVPIIGIEVHVEPKTLSKMFCGCSADHFKAEPNGNVCPVCLGLPGALPVPNRAAIDKLVLLGQALGCKVSEDSYFERKHYFYPDLPKGYQISQYRRPLCINGEITISNFKSQNSNLDTKEESDKVIRINRVHMEEDTAKLKHQGGRTLIDFNRSGVSLIEIVSEADISSAEEAKEYLKEITRLIRWLDISDADMEKGTMRLEANVSIQERTKFKVQNSKVLPIGNYKLNPRSELKNINSFRFVVKAINYEISRQQKALATGEELKQETRGWNETKGVTYTQRVKEESDDYRYFPEPDIPNLKIKKQKLKMDAKAGEVEMPWEAEKRLEELNIPYQYISVIAQDCPTLAYFDELMRGLKKTSGKSKMVDKLASDFVNRKLYIKKPNPSAVIEQLSVQKTQTHSEEDLAKAISRVLKVNQKAIGDYKSGKENALQFLIGQVMKELKGQADPKEVTRVILDLLAKS